MVSHSRTVRLGWVLLLVLALSPPVLAQQFGAILRDENALALTPTTRSWGMGGTYVGIDRPWSMNPASITSTEQMTGEITYGNWNQEDGPGAGSGRVDAWLPVGDRLVLRLMGYYYASDGSEDALGPFQNLEYDSTTIGLQAGFELFDWWSIGAGAYPYEKGNVELDFPLGDGATSGIDAECLSLPGSLQAGTLFRLPANVNLGAQFIYIFDELEADYDDPEAISEAVGGAPLSESDTYRIHYETVGVSWEPLEWLLVGVDYWIGEAEGEAFIKEAEFDQDVDRWNFGAEVRPCEYFSIRAGGANGGATAGFTLSPIENLDINYAFVDEAFRDKEDVWGTTELHTVSLTLRF